MQLVAPVRVVAILEMEPLGQCRGEGHFAAVFAHSTAQGMDRIISFALRNVVPAFDGGSGELDIAFAHGMTPRPLCKGADGRLELSGAGGSLKSWPTTENRKHAHSAPVGLLSFRVITSPHEKGEGSAITSIGRPAGVQKRMLCGPGAIIVKASSAGLSRS